MTTTLAAVRAQRRQATRAFYETHPGYHYKMTKGWRKRQPAKRYAQKARYYKSHAVGRTNGYSRWTSEEMVMLLHHSIPDTELARSLKRTLRAVCMKRVRLKRLGITSPAELT